MERGAGHNAQFGDYRTAGRLSAPRGETLLLFPPQPIEHFMASARARDPSSAALGAQGDPTDQGRRTGMLGRLTQRGLTPTLVAARHDVPQPAVHRVSQPPAVLVQLAPAAVATLGRRARKKQTAECCRRHRKQ
jgi:hypothetical protein